MTVEYTPFKSNSGFASPNFTVNSLGTLTVNADAVITGTVYASSISFGTPGSAGITLIEFDDSTISLSSDIRNSSLTSLGVLTRLEVDGDVIFGLSSSTFFSIDDGRVVINSTNTGAIDNIEIGAVIPARANFTEVQIGPGDSSGNLRIEGTLDVTGTGVINVISSTSVTSDNVIINEQPVQPNHSTRKDYVDTRVTAFSIAFGA